MKPLGMTGFSVETQPRLSQYNARTAKYNKMTFISITFGCKIAGDFWYNMSYHETESVAAEYAKEREGESIVNGWVVIMMNNGSWNFVCSYNRSLVDIDYDINDGGWIIKPTNLFINTIITSKKLAYHNQTITSPWAHTS